MKLKETDIKDLVGPKTKAECNYLIEKEYQYILNLKSMLSKISDVISKGRKDNEITNIIEVISTGITKPIRTSYYLIILEALEELLILRKEIKNIKKEDYITFRGKL